MTMLPLRLTDHECVWEDPQAKTAAFFCCTEAVAIDLQTLGDLKAVSDARGRVSTRICLHVDPADELHQMIVLHRSGSYHRPHMHRQKHEGYHIIQGRMLIACFDDTGAITAVHPLSLQEQLLYRTALQQYHTLIPLSDYVIYQEVRPGPFVPEGDSKFADWAPELQDTAGIEKYQKNLLKRIAQDYDLS